MPETTIILILLTLVIALAVAGFQYFYRAKGELRRNLLFASLRFLSVWMILLLLVNPELEHKEYFTEKPELILAVDNSASIAHFEQADAVRDFVKDIQSDSRIREQFDIHIFGFGEHLESDPDLNFDHRQSDIPGSLKELNELFSGQSAPTLLITDGNQTFGEELVYAAEGFRQPLIPVLVGDTSALKDLQITRVNVNKYSYLGNRFPVEIMVNYFGEGVVNSRVEIKSGNQVLFSRELSLDETESSAIVNSEMSSTSVGVHTYTVEVSPLENEENLWNNQQKFVVEVIDERSKILLLYSVLHPDLGTIKKSIESNPQREVILQRIDQVELEAENYQLIILYQPDAQFSGIMQAIAKDTHNMLVVGGPLTDWQMLNNHQGILQQEITGQTEEYLPVFNSDFDLFQVEDIGFEDFPPLIGSFGEMEVKKGSHTLLGRKIQDIETDSPLLLFSNEKDSKIGYLLGSEIWTWRSHVFREEESFEAFDGFISKVIQFLSSQTDRNRFMVSYDPLYRGNTNVKLTAEYFDRNYVFDPGAEIVLELKNKTSGETRTIPFVRRANQYLVNLEHLSPSEYSFSARVKGEGLVRSGQFTLSSFDAEKQFSRADLESLRQVAQTADHKLSFVEEPEVVKDFLLNSKKFLPVQKSRENAVPLIEWYYLLGILLLSLSTEWFLRKYYGFI